MKGSNEQASNATKSSHKNVSGKIGNFTVSNLSLQAEAENRIQLMATVKEEEGKRTLMINWSEHIGEQNANLQEHSPAVESGKVEKKSEELNAAEKYDLEGMLLDIGKEIDNFAQREGLATAENAQIFDSEKKISLEILLFQETLKELLKNAIDAGSTRLCVEHITHDEKGPCHKVTISDEGEGFPSTFHGKKINKGERYEYKEFYPEGSMRINSTKSEDKTKTGGFGLGLLTLENFLSHKEYDGKLFIENGVSKNGLKGGAIITIELPEEILLTPAEFAVKFDADKRRWQQAGGAPVKEKKGVKLLGQPSSLHTSIANSPIAGSSPISGSPMSRSSISGSPISGDPLANRSGKSSFSANRAALTAARLKLDIAKNDLNIQSGVKVTPEEKDPKGLKGGPRNSEDVSKPEQSSSRFAQKLNFYHAQTSKDKEDKPADKEEAKIRQEEAKSPSSPGQGKS